MKKPLITIRIDAVKDGGIRYARYEGKRNTDAWISDRSLTAEEVEQLRTNPDVDVDDDDGNQAA